MVSFTTMALKSDERSHGIIRAAVGRRDPFLYDPESFLFFFYELKNKDSGKIT